VSYLFSEGHAVTPLVEALRYKPGSIPYGHINGPGVD
jgi:hypothetical protein